MFDLVQQEMSFYYENLGFYFENYSISKPNVSHDGVRFSLAPKKGKLLF